MRPYEMAALFTCALGLIFFPHLTQAHLGGGPDSIESDRKTLNAQVLLRRGVKESTRLSLPYSVTEMIVSGVKVREYLSQSGVVFAIAWRGVHHPNFTALLGSYQLEYQKAFEAHRAQFGLHRGMKARAIHSGGVHVEFGGHLRNMGGRAYVPLLIPSGVTLDEIQ